MKAKITINNFDLFIDAVKTANDLVNAGKFIVDSTGLKLYGKNTVARCEIETNAIVSDVATSFCFDDIKSFIKVLTTISKIHEGNFIDFKFEIDGNLIKFNSKKFKAKLKSVEESVIMDNISKKLETVLKPVAEFTTSQSLMKQVADHQFLMPKIEDLRVYLHIDTDLEKNTVYATVGNKSNDLSNALTLKFGLLTFGALDRELVIDLQRLQVLQIIPNDEVQVQLMDKNCLFSKTVINKKNSWLSVTIIDSLRTR